MREECSNCKFFVLGYGYDGYCKKNKHNVTGIAWCRCFKKTVPLTASATVTA